MGEKEPVEPDTRSWELEEQVAPEEWPVGEERKYWEEVVGPESTPEEAGE